MSEKRNRVIENIIKDNPGYARYTIDKDGEIAAYTVCQVRQQKDFWDTCERNSMRYIGRTIPFKNNGWKKHFYNETGHRLIYKGY